MTRKKCSLMGRQTDSQTTWQTSSTWNFFQNLDTPKLNNCNERGEIETKREPVIFHEDASSMLQVMLSNKPSEYKSHCIKKVNQRNVPLTKQVGRNCLMDRKNKRNSYFQFIFLLQRRYLGDDAVLLFLWKHHLTSDWLIGVVNVPRRASGGNRRNVERKLSTGVPNGDERQIARKIFEKSQPVARGKFHRIK